MLFLIRCTASIPNMTRARPISAASANALERRFCEILAEHLANQVTSIDGKAEANSLTAKFGRSPERYKRLLRLSNLSPGIVAAVFEGAQPPRLTNRFLQNLAGLPLSWSEQEQLLLA
ncbi:hypothetical protein BSL82_10565 [Tardibacter chloracetimidivorans]|uniref:Uncharacterized protein n=2 Tax=Tardibacter chloracetimidivorans TaxID=1921510 RepID=A0A1L3ZVQ4_9SPHN|nr:hypothetical protein BSL82_10565 [Tardibacter chloracetimidivorans]